MAKAYSECENNVARQVEAEKLKSGLFSQVKFLNQCHTTTVLPLVMKNGKALPCLSTLQN